LERLPQMNFFMGQKNGCADMEHFEGWADQISFRAIERRRQIHRYNGTSVLIVGDCTAHTGGSFHDQCTFRNVHPLGNFAGKSSQAAAGSAMLKTSRQYEARSWRPPPLHHSNVFSAIGTRSESPEGRVTNVKTGHPNCQQAPASSEPGTRPGIRRKLPKQDHTVNRSSHFLNCLFALRDDRTQLYGRLQ
jgi:hypothetical protein